MKVLAWNVQGAKKCQIREEIKYLKAVQKPDLVFLLETVVSESNTQKKYSRN